MNDLHDSIAGLFADAQGWAPDHETSRESEYVQSLKRRKSVDNAETWTRLKTNRPRRIERNRRKRYRYAARKAERTGLPVRVYSRPEC